MKKIELKKKKGSKIKLYRRCAQISVALVFILVPWLNSLRISWVHGNFLCFNLAGIPLADPLAVLQIIVKNAYLSPDLIISALVAIGIAIVLGTVFCSWICPYGLLSDFGQILHRKVRGKKKKQPLLSAFTFKLVIFFFGLITLFTFSTTPILNQLSMPAWYSRIFQFIFIQQFFSLAIMFILIVLSIEIFTGKRYWCQLICPQSVLLILVKQLNPKRMKVGYNPDLCSVSSKKKGPCAAACNLGLNPKVLNTGIETECTNCGDCIVACSRCNGALTYKF